MGKRWIPMYLSAADEVLLRERLNADSEVAYLLAESDGTWRAHRSVDAWPEGFTFAGGTRHVSLALWHEPSGPFEVSQGTRDHRTSAIILDPFSTFRAIPTANLPPTPFTQSPSVMALELSYGGQVFPRGSSPEAIGLSHLGWGANWFAADESPPLNRWWKRMQRWVRTNATRISRGGDLDDGPEIWAFPKALEEIRSGRARAM